jgi:hypothetical protein
VHALDGAVKIPSIPAKLVSKEFLTGENEEPDTILKLEFDQPIEPFALAAPSQGSLTTSKNMTEGEVDFGRMVTFDRIECTIENPGHRRGQAMEFTLDAKQADGSWETVFKGAVYGSIFSKRIEAVTARKVRLTINAPIRQLDLFPALGVGDR